ncbi:MAG: hypothetical protein A2900_03590 [Candidatus Chisholmbacteria bacterium RIFCSPLOWO2_01_FULL_50_28]|uniref:Uncharacterized protein n=1 Tax=Candidatus Chisholmbacteria bacterium RIFCSPHIGHO2_01_FULL_52_32 TaxID=1797591 RepID=A0A1G1VSY5_9BACT|nr:MAG: hypothetical protein A2786_03155 [Candidatus Chisholmbacteria bacterium RIFCSPHIGHO2_01_FULL_52_32]OGY20159.1 MAG: hypothetical protein A2900_03590 [Candidatus Chisholmbacteria bacterium RIFCSPLOWO2_01_FULL_50_28]
MKRVQSAFVLVLVSVIVLRMAFIFLRTPSVSIDHERLRSVWLHSQYNLGKGYEFFGNMPDEDLYAFSALEYVSGKNPVQVNYENPPLAKYLLGISYLVFGNILVVQFIASFGILLLTYLLTRHHFLLSPIAFLPPLLLVVDPLFVKASTTVNLDLIQLFFALVALYLLTLRQRSPFLLFFLGCAIGGIMASKVFFVGLLLLVYSSFVLWLNRTPRLLSSIVPVFIGCLLVYLGSYAVYFAYRSPSDFLKLHIDIIRLYRSYLPEYPWFEIWRILLVGQWRTWFAKPSIQPVAEYWLGWPIAAVLSGSLLLSRRALRLPWPPSTILLGWALAYLLFQSVHVVFPRYLLLVLPILYALSAIRISTLPPKIPS